MPKQGSAGEGKLRGLLAKAKQMAASQERQRYGAEAKILKIEQLVSKLPCTCDKQTSCTKCRIHFILRS
jgi:hypothetical protein